MRDLFLELRNRRKRKKLLKKPIIVTMRNRTLTVTAKNLLITLAGQKMYRELKKPDVNIDLCKEIINDIELIYNDAPTITIATKYLTNKNPIQTND